MANILLHTVTYDTVYNNMFRSHFNLKPKEKFPVLLLLKRNLLKKRIYVAEIK